MWTRCSTILSSAVLPVLLSIVVSPRPLLGETVVYNPWGGAFFWWGEHEGNQIGNLLGNNYPGNPVDGIPTTGSGSVDNWSRNWFGRHQATGDETCQSGCQPPVFMGLPPQDGDSLIFNDLFVSQDGPFNISGGSVSLPSGHVTFGIDATFSGGAYATQSAYISTGGNYGNFATFNGTSITSPNVTIIGGNLTAPTQTTINLNTAFVNAANGKIDIVGGTASNPWKLNLTASVLFANTISIGPDSLLYGPETALDFVGDPASFINASLTKVAARNDAVVRLNVHSQTPQFTPSSIIHIADAGQAILTIDSGGHFHTAKSHVGVLAGSRAEINLNQGSWTMLDAFFGEFGEAIVSATQESHLTSHNAVIGKEQSSEVSLVTLDHNSTWNTNGYLHIGEKGFGRLNVKNGSSVNVTQAIVLGVEEDSSGIVDITSTAPFTAHTTFDIGRKGAGTLNIHAGGKVTAESDMLIGAQKKGVGTVEIDGAGAELRTTHKLYVGNGDAMPMGNDTNGMGTISVRNSGTLKADQDVVLGLNSGSHGVLNLYGAQSKLELAQAATLTIGKSGKGELNLFNGATFTSMGEVKLGELDGSDGTVRINGENSHWNVQGKLTVGDKTRGHVEVLNKGKLSVPADQIDLGNETDSDGKLIVDGDGTEVTIGGNLYIGQRGKGHVEIKNKAKLTVPGVGIFLGTQAQGDGTLTLDGEGTTLDFSGQLIVADFGKGKISLQNEADFTTGDFTLGHFPNSHGTLEVKGVGGVVNQLTTFTTNGTLKAGAGGKGTITVENGGRLTTQGDAIVGEDSTSGTLAERNTVTVSGDESHWTIGGDLTIGKHGKASMTVADGAKLTVNGATINIGEESGSDGILTITHSAERLAPTLEIDTIVKVGKSGKGKLEISGENTKANVRSLAVGADENGDGTVEISGDAALLKATDGISIGGEGQGKLAVKNGALAESTQQITIDASKVDHARATVTGVGTSGGDLNHRSRMRAPEIIVGEAGYGHLVVSEDGLVNAPESTTLKLRVAANPDSHGKVDVTGSADSKMGQIIANDLEAGVGGTAEIDLSTHSWLSVGNLLTLGSFAESGSAQVNVSGNSFFLANRIDALNHSTISLSGNAHLRLTDTATFRMGGSAQHPATLNVGGSAIADNGSLLAGVTGKAIVNVTSAGNLEMTQIVVGSANPNVQAGSQLNVTGSAAKASAPIVTVHPGASITTTSGGTIKVESTATINGIVNVLGGRMQIGDFDANATTALGAVTVGPNGVLLGSGTIKGNLIATDPFGFPNVQGARIKSGNSPGLLIVEGDVLLEAGTVLEMEIGGATAGTQHDQLLATGSMTVSGLLDLKIVNSGGGFQLPSLGQQYTLLGAAGGVTTTLENAASLRSVAGGSLVGWSFGVSGNFAVLEATSITSLADGDYNGDGAVDAADYVVWRRTAGGINLAADGNRDGAIDHLDYNVWRSNFAGASAAGFGAGPPNQSSGTVPEPSPLLLVIAAGCTVARGRPRRPPRPADCDEALWKAIY